jgi:hypothetical protein
MCFIGLWRGCGALASRDGEVNVSMQRPIPYSDPALRPSSEPSAADAELLARARLARQADVVPEVVRQRLLARALEEAQRPSGVLPTELVPIASRGLGTVLGWATAMAFGVVLVANLRVVLSGRDEPEAAGAEAAPAAEPSAAQRMVNDRLFQSALFRAPAPLLGGSPPAQAGSLFAERPFSEQSRSWQVRRWPDLSVGPDQPADYQFERGALCVPLGGSERVVGGWPWLSREEQAPAPVALRAGKAYRLVFQAWAREPLPAQVLVAVGHATLPFSAAAGARVEVTEERQFFEVRFTAPHDDPNVGVGFLAMGSGASTRLCMGELTLSENAGR